MKKFTSFIKEKKVKKGSKDPAQARSLLKQAKERLEDLKTLPLSDSNASFRFESAYEVIRETLHSFLAEKGYKPYSHEAIFVYCFEKKIIKESEYSRCDRYREIRNDINYRGKKVLTSEAKETIEFASMMYKKLK